MKNPANKFKFIIIGTFFLLAIAIFFPLIIPWLMVAFFVFLSTKLTVDGIKTYQGVLDEISNCYGILSQELKNACEQIPENARNNINRFALIDVICDENGALQISDKKKRSYQLLPNLLLAIGLLGTFVGITINLFLLSRNTSGELELQKTLADIIGSMAIAFVSSLIGLACSIYITKFYPPQELDIQRNKLINRLENYLDNEYLIKQNNLQKTLDGIKTSVDKYGSDLHTFVREFPQYIKDFKNAVTDSSQILTTSANNFYNLANNSAKTIDNSAQSLEKSTNQMTNISNNFSTIGASLQTSTQSFEAVVSGLGKYNNNLEQIGNTLLNNSSQTQFLITSNNQGLNNFCQQLEENTKLLSKATEFFNASTSQMTTALEGYIQGVDTNNSNVNLLLKNIENHMQTLNNLQLNISNLVNSIVQNNNSN